MIPVVRCFVNWEIRFPSKKNKLLGIGPHVPWRSHLTVITPHPQRSPRTGRCGRLRRSRSRWRARSSSSRQQCLLWAQDTCGHPSFLSLSWAAWAWGLAFPQQLALESAKSQLPGFTSQHQFLQFFLCSPYHWNSSLLEESWGWSVRYMVHCQFSSYSWGAC